MDALVCAPGIENHAGDVKSLYVGITVALWLIPPFMALVIRCVKNCHKQFPDPFEMRMGIAICLAFLFSIPVGITHLLLLFNVWFPYDDPWTDGSVGLFQNIINRCSRYPVEHVNAWASVYSETTVCEYEDCTCRDEFVADDIRNCSVSNPELNTVDHVCVKPEDECCEWGSWDSHELCEVFGPTLCSVDCTTSAIVEAVWCSPYRSGVQYPTCNGIDCAVELIDRWTFEDKTGFLDVNGVLYLWRTSIDGPGLPATAFVGTIWFAFIAFFIVSTIKGYERVCIKVCSDCDQKKAPASQQPAQVVEMVPPIRRIPPKP